MRLITRRSQYKPGIYVFRNFIDNDGKVSTYLYKVTSYPKESMSYWIVESETYSREHNRFELTEGRYITAPFKLMDGEYCEDYILNDDEVMVELL